MQGGFVAGCAGAALLAITGLAASAADGEQLFKSKCSGCHSAQKVLDGVRKVEPDKRQAHFDKLLAKHYYKPDDAQRQAVLDYLLGAVK
jgi:mono/diheme cytochrome c family protein